jgi:uncharacterized protein
MRISATCIVLCVAFALAIAPPARATPSDDLRKSLRHTGHVNDFAGLLPAAEKEALEARCRQLRERTGAELAVVTLRSLQGGQIDDFANKLFAEWGIGQKGRNNGLLLLVAMDERRARIEVGYGLEPIIPDVLAGRIIDNQLRPQFREQRYAAGLSAAVNALVELVEKGEPADRTALAAEEALGVLPTLLFLALFVAIGGFSIGSGLGLRNVAAVLFGLMFAGVPLMMGIMEAGILGPVLHAPLAILASIFGWNSVRNKTARKYRRRYSNTPWTWGGPTFSTGGGWTSGGGGGFSGGWGGFGGGSSGGGGASGGW